MIKISNMSYSIPSNGTILSNINMQVSKGDFKGILGRNGAGKTTLIDLIMGFRRPQEGDVSILNNNPATSSRAIFTEVAYLSQEIWLKDNITVEAFFKFHRHYFSSKTSKYSIDYQDELLDTFKLDYKAKIGGLSTGQKRRVQIIAALAARPQILLIDEITAVLDPDARQVFFKLLKDINTEYSTTILLATNIAEDLKDRVDSVYFISDTQLTSYQTSEIDSLFAGGLR